MGLLSQPERKSIAQIALSQKGRTFTDSEGADAKHSQPTAKFLEALKYRGQMTLSEVAKEIDIPYPKAHVLFQELEKAGYVERR